MSTASRALEAARMAYGAVQVVAPVRLASTVGVRPSRTAVVLTRVLGARHLVQGALLLALDDPRSHRAASILDGLHAASQILIRARAADTDKRLSTVDGLLSTGVSIAEAVVR